MRWRRRRLREARFRGAAHGSVPMVARALAVALAILGVSMELSVGQTIVPNSVYETYQTLVAVDGTRRLNLYCIGLGQPVVMLEAGSGNGMMTWRFVQAAIGTFTRVCAYDRAGLGFSDAAVRPSDVRNIADDLHRLRQAARIPSPVVFVGHSLGGEVGLLFAATYPTDVAGMVLVDPGFPNMLRALRAELPPESRTAITDALNRTLARQRACLDLARNNELAHPRTGQARACVDASGDPNRPNEDLQRVLARTLALPRAWAAMISETDTFIPKDNQPDADTAEIDALSPSFGDKPLAVLTRGKLEGAPGVPPAYVARVEAAWKAGHDRLAGLSSRGHNTVVPDTGHYIQIERPDAVIDAVRNVVTAVRASGKPGQ